MKIILDPEPSLTGYKEHWQVKYSVDLNEFWAGRASQQTTIKGPTRRNPTTDKYSIASTEVHNK